MAMPLKPKDLDLLRDVLRHAGAARDDLFAAAEASTFTREQRKELCGLINAEFLRTGLAADDEPNARGRELEALLDEVNRPNLMKGA